MDAQRLPLAFVLIISLCLSRLPSPTTATVPHFGQDDERPPENDLGDGDGDRKQPSPFPQHLDISGLQNLPLVILHPRTPINLQMLPGQSLASLHKSLTPDKIMQLIQSTAFKLPAEAEPEDEREERSRKFAGAQAMASIGRPESVPYRHQAMGRTPQGRSLFSTPGNNGWFQKMRGSFSSMFPSMRPFREQHPFNFGLPSMNMPVFSSHQPHFQGGVSPFLMAAQQQSQFLPWRNYQQGMASVFPGGDMTTAASYAQPTRTLFGSPFRPSGHLPFAGELAASGSALVPHGVSAMGYPYFAPRYAPNVQRHKPLFNNVDGLHASSMEISNAFADFTDSKEHGPEVSQRFGAVGHSINTFLKMMGLGATDSFSMGDAGGFGGGAHMAAMDSTPIARSMDFYPGYGNQALLDDVEDFPIFEEDITEDFLRKMNITLPKDGDKAKEDSKKDASSKEKLAATEKDKDLKDPKGASAKPLSGEKTTTATTVASQPTQRPVANYRIPPTSATVAPGDRKQPVAIYQHFSPQDARDAPKPPAYAPAQALPPHHQEAEANPNRLVDEDKVRQWQSVHSGRGYVEKRPVPNVDVLNVAVTPESLRLLHQVLGGGA